MAEGVEAGGHQGVPGGGAGKDTREQQGVAGGGAEQDTQGQQGVAGGGAGQDTGMYGEWRRGQKQDDNMVHGEELDKILQANGG